MVLVEDARDVAEPNVGVAIVEPRQSEHRFEIVGDAVLVDRHRRQRRKLFELDVEFLLDFVGRIELLYPAPVLGDLLVLFLLFSFSALGRRLFALVFRSDDETGQHILCDPHPVFRAIGGKQLRHSDPKSVRYVSDQAVYIVRGDQTLAQISVVVGRQRQPFVKRIEQFASERERTRILIVGNGRIGFCGQLAVYDLIDGIGQDLFDQSPLLDVHDQIAAVALVRDLGDRAILLAGHPYLRDALRLVRSHCDKPQLRPRLAENVAYLVLLPVSRGGDVGLLPRQKGAVLHEQNGYLHIFIL